MSTLRYALSTLAVLTLGGGYFASQWAVFSGEAPEYSKKVDSPPVQWLALGLICAAVLLSFMREVEPE